jgi:hypothetical protein
MMVPKKIYWLLGHSNLGLILEQERKHWLMRIQSKKHLQDMNTGLVYQGRIENIGSDIVMESEQLPENNTAIGAISFLSDVPEGVFVVDKCTFPHNPMVDGLMCCRINSMNFPTETETGKVNMNNYQLRLTECEEVIIPFGVSPDTTEVFAGRWLKTKIAPEAMVYHDITGKFDLNRHIRFKKDVTDATYYYPLDEMLQPLKIAEQEKGTWVSESVLSNEYIGLPLYWFTCEQSRIGPMLTFENNNDDSGNPLFYVSKEGNSGKYFACIYTGIAGEYSKSPNTPDGRSTSEWRIRVTPRHGRAFSPQGRFPNFIHRDIVLESTHTNQKHRVRMRLPDEETLVSMSGFSDWTFEDGDRSAWIPMDKFDTNCLSDFNSPLESVFNIQFNMAIPFANEIKESHICGLRCSSSNVSSDIHTAYPHDLNGHVGLPEHLRNTNGIPQYTCLYAIANTPEAKRVAAILLDPGRSPTQTPSGQRGLRIDSRLENPNTYRLEMDGGNTGVNLSHWAGKTWTWAIGPVRLTCRIPALSSSVSSLRLEIVSVVPNNEWISANHFSRNLTGTNPSQVYNTILTHPDAGAGPQMRLTFNRVFYNWMIGTGSMPDELLGRAYILSSDPITYMNNEQLRLEGDSFCKPGRTAARMCDVPYSVMQLVGIHGLSPTMVVDPRYVRSQASFREVDQHRILNTLNRRWVKPTDRNEEGQRINGTNMKGEFTFPIQQGNAFIFQSKELLDSIDLVNQNDFRVHIRTNPMVDPFMVQIAHIPNGGQRYAVGNHGQIVVGGFSFRYDVTEVDSYGTVIKAVLSVNASNPGNPNHEAKRINAANFDNINPAGVTRPYGTSPCTGNGTGLTVELVITNWNHIQPQRGEIHRDLFAMVKEEDGLWLYNYQFKRPPTTDVPQLGDWYKVEHVFKQEPEPFNDGIRGLTTKDAFINSVIPSLRRLSIGRDERHAEKDVVSAYQTSGFVNIVDRTRTPILVPQMKESHGLVAVDICKFYCHGIIQSTLDTNVSRTNKSVIEHLKNQLAFDSYLIWRWIDRQAGQFEYGIVMRSFNNFLSTDATSFLPKNDLKYQRFVHANSGTNVVWHNEWVGTMMWAYNPRSTVKETYVWDDRNGQISIERESFDWSTIDIRCDPNSREKLRLVDDQNRLLWNITTNNREQSDIGMNDTPLITVSGDSFLPVPIYRQPDFHEEWLNIGEDVTGPTYLQRRPMGNWQLVYPDIPEYSLRMMETSKTFVPIKLQAIRGVNFGENPTILDRYNNNVNPRTLLLDQSRSDGTRVRVFNPETKRYDTL